MNHRLQLPTIGIFKDKLKLIVSEWVYYISLKYTQVPLMADGPQHVLPPLNVCCFLMVGPT